MSRSNLPREEKKLRCPNWEAWSHHRSGWKDVVSILKLFHDAGGVAFDSYLDSTFSKGSASWKEEPFCGFFHLAPRHLAEYADARYSHGSSVEYMLTSEHWARSEPLCKGIWTVSPYLAKFIRQLTKVPVEVIWHPSTFPDKVFSYEKFLANKQKLLVMTGDWMRKFETLYLMDSPGYHKCIVQCTTATKNTCDRIRHWLPSRFQTVNILGFLPVQGYDRMMCENVVFLDLHDCCACNTVVDCIVRNTPLLVRKMEGVVDYLGKDYPLYYESIAEAEVKIQDIALIGKTTEYMSNLKIKEKMTLDSFVEQFYASDIYRSLPPPGEPQTNRRMVAMV